MEIQNKPKENPDNYLLRVKTCKTINRYNIPGAKPSNI